MILGIKSLPLVHVASSRFDFFSPHCAQILDIPAMFQREQQQQCVGIKARLRQCFPLCRYYQRYNHGLHYVLH